MAYNPFSSRHKFQDDVWGQIMLNDLERDVIDTPEFQRLFRTSQMGFVDLVYQTANHTRGAHSIGACFISNMLVTRLVENTSRLNDDYPGKFANFEISASERTLIRLGALLHDVSHVPLSHDLEKKTHRIPYEIPGMPPEEIRIRSWYGHYTKHDDYETNPLLYRLICDTQTSVLARVLSRYSKPFYDFIVEDSRRAEGQKLVHRHIAPFVEELGKAKAQGWDPETNLLPDLLFHLLTYETEEQGQRAVREIAVGFNMNSQPMKVSWGIGPESKRELLHDLWYQPFRHDVIGNTLSADLIDYLTRDPKRLGTKRRIDLHLLSYYVVLPSSYTTKAASGAQSLSTEGTRAEEVGLRRHRCAIDLLDLKRGTTRVFLLNDIFRLLDLRQDIHEKAVMHRVVQSANAMLARGMLLLGDLRPGLDELVPVGHTYHALYGEDLFFHTLLERCVTAEGYATSKRLHDAERIFRKLIERRVYRPLMIIPGDRAFHKSLCPEFPEGLTVGTSKGEARKREISLRTLATVVDSAYYSSFLLFVCMIVEKYLEGVFDTDKQATDYAARICAPGGDRKSLSGAMGAIPSRVIIWTTPYKQLYKDPAVVVAVEDLIEAVDEIVVKGAGRLPQYEDLAGRVNTAIADADSKYAALWQLQVFISDGLFYSGILNKVIGSPDAKRPNAAERDSNNGRLSKAQGLLVEALLQIRADWPRLTGHLKSAKAVAETLSTQMEIEDFQELVHRWATDYGRALRGAVDPASGLSTVDIGHYAHDFSLGLPVQAKEGRNCRDSRYKFDRGAGDVWRKAKSQSGSAAYALTEFLEKLGITSHELLSELEFGELVEMFESPESRPHIEWLMSAFRSGRKAAPSDLKILWRTGLPSLTEHLPGDSDLPITREEIERWLEGRLGRLLPHVERELNSSLKSESILGMIEWAIPRRGRREVFEYLERKFRNEKNLIWNRLIEDQIVDGLKREWGYPDGEKTAT